MTELAVSQQDAVGQTDKQLFSFKCTDFVNEYNKNCLLCVDAVKLS